MLELSQTMVLFTYTTDKSSPESRWANEGIKDVFFANLDDARQAVLEIFKSVTEGNIKEDPQEWFPVHIERVEIGPITAENIAILLNVGIGPLIRAYEIVETIS
jgi:hypothetical protein